METVHYINMERHHRDETFRNRSFHFANGLLVTDLAGNIKGALGRYDRPGLMEIDGSHGAIVQEAVGHWTGRAEVRLVPEHRRLDGSGGYSDGTRCFTVTGMPTATSRSAPCSNVPTS